MGCKNTAFLDTDKRITDISNNDTHEKARKRADDFGMGVPKAGVYRQGSPADDKLNGIGRKIPQPTEKVVGKLRNL